MNQYTFVVFAFGILSLLLSVPSSSASVLIACSPNASPKLRELCYALEQIRSDTPSETGKHYIIFYITFSCKNFFL